MAMSKCEFRSEYKEKVEELTGQEISENEISEAFSNYEQLLFVSCANDAELKFDFDRERNLTVLFCPK